MSNDSHISDFLPDRRLSSAQEIAVLYSLCETYRKEKDYETTDADGLTQEQLSFVTPDSHSELWEGDKEERGNVVFARVDLSGDEPKFDGENPVGIELCEPDAKYKWAYIANPGKAGAAIDYSVTNHLGSSGSDAETVAYDSWGHRFLRGRFENWAQKEELDSIVESSDTGVISAMRELGETDSELERLEDALLDEYAEDDEIEGYVSIKVKLDEDGEYLYPSETHELVEAGVEINKEKLRSGRSIGDKKSFGTGVGMVTDEETTVVGASKGVFAEYGKKQPDSFSNLNPAEGWKQRPISETSAQHIAGFSSSIEDDFSWTINGMSCIYLPYPDAPITESVFDEFYEEVFSPLRGGEEDDGSMTADQYISMIATLIKRRFNKQAGESLDLDIDTEGEFDTEFGLCVYAVMAEKEQSSVYNVWLEESDVSIKPVLVSNEYEEIMFDFEGSVMYGDLLDNMDYSGLLSTGGILQKVLYGSFFENTMLSSLDELESSGTFATEDDRRLQVTAPLLRGGRVNSDKLLSDFVTRIERMHRDNMGSEQGFPGFMTFIQMVQLAALETADGLQNKSIKSFALDTNYCSMTNNEERLAQFIETHDALDSPAAQSAFLVGGLVGRLSKYQRYKQNLSQTLVDQYPVSSVSKRTIASVASDVLDKNNEYSGMEGTEMYNRYTSRLYDSMLVDEPEDWPLSNTETRWLYALGISYGQDDTHIEEDDEDNDNNGDN